MHRLVQVLAIAAITASFAACGGTSATTSVGPGLSVPPDFPIGSWVVTITEQDLRDAGITAPGVIAENTGTITKTYSHDGTWTVVQETKGAVATPVFSGTFRPIGLNGIQETTAFPTDFLGEVVNFTWQREGTGIRFTVVDPPDVILPITTETHVWQPK